MAYDARNLSVIAYANGFTLWHYTTTDASVTSNDYFNNASPMMKVGDLIIANITTDNIASLVALKDVVTVATNQVIITVIPVKLVASARAHDGNANSRLAL